MSDERFEGLPHRAEDEETGGDERLSLYHFRDNPDENQTKPDRILTEEELARLLGPDGQGVSYPITIPVKRLHPQAKLPERKTAGAAAADVYAVKETVLQPGVTTLVDLGIKVAIPEGYELVLVPRSGLSCKGVVVRNSPGTIDSDYRGEVKAILKYEPENTCAAIIKAYKVLYEFTKNLVSMNAFETARSKLMDHVKNGPFQPYTISAGDRVGQLKLYKVIPHVYSEVDELDETERGDGGFGSTGR